MLERSQTLYVLEENLSIDKLNEVTSLKKKCYLAQVLDYCSLFLQYGTIFIEMQENLTSA